VHYFALREADIPIRSDIYAVALIVMELISKINPSLFLNGILVVSQKENMYILNTLNS
jgi:hypothetical protein